MTTIVEDHGLPLISIGDAVTGPALREAVEAIKFKDPEDAGYVRAYAYGHNEAIDKVLAVLAASQPDTGPALDVERLARAIDAAEDRLVATGAMDRITSLDNDRLARELAAEYERLATHDGPRNPREEPQ